jgi:type II secretory pathway component HofQ
LITPERSKAFRGRYADPLARIANTTVTLKDGDTIVIGEVTAEDIKRTEQKIPGTGEIPIFRDKEKEAQTRKLVIFLKAKIQ